MTSVLLVDDDPDLRAITAVALRLDGDFTVETAESTSAALALLRSAGERFRLILAGASTSDIDQSLIEAIRWLPASRETPVIFLARQASDEDREHYRAMGAAGMIAVPFDPIELAREIADLLQSAAH